jgi:hypothetical protein
MTTRVMTRSPLAFARQALRTAERSLPAYSSARSRHDYTQPQLLAVLALKQFFKTDYRGIAAALADSSDLRAALRPTKVPHYSTLAYAAGRLLKNGDSRPFKGPSSPRRPTAGWPARPPRPPSMPPGPTAGTPPATSSSDPGAGGSPASAGPS